MQKTLTDIVRSALEIDHAGFNRLTDEVTQLLGHENGRIGNLQVTGKLITTRPQGTALIIGDLHGDLESLIDILKQSSFLERIGQNHDLLLMFLGDYGDRGPYSAEVYYTVLELKILYPEQVVLMRGNHEGPEDLMASPHNLPEQFQGRFGRDGTDAYAKIREMFNYLYNAVLVEGQYLLLHGGPPAKAKTIDDLAQAHNCPPEQDFLEDILWSDPDESMHGTSPSPRGAGKLFGKDVTDEALSRFNAKILIRGHEPCPEGYKMNHEGKILTLFSRKGPPYFNIHGAYLEIDLSQDCENARQLVQHIHKF